MVQWVVYTVHHGPVGSLHHGPVGSVHHGPVGRVHHGPVGRVNHGPVGRVHHGPVGSVHPGPVGPVLCVYIMVQWVLQYNPSRELKIVQRFKVSSSSYSQRSSEKGGCMPHWRHGYKL